MTERNCPECFSIPPVVTVHATFTAHGDRLLDLHPFRVLLAFAWVPRHYHPVGLLLGCQ